MRAPVWEGLAAHFTLLKHLQLSAFILILLVTYLRPSELLALKEKVLVAQLVPLLLWWFVVITTCETGVNTKARVPLWVGPSGERVQNFPKISNTRSMDSTHCRKIRQMVLVWQPTATFSFARSETSWKRPRNVSEVKFDKNDSKSSRSQTHDGKCFSVSGGKSCGSGGYVLDAKFSLRFDVTQPRNLTRIRQDVSAGKCNAGMISPPRLHTSCSSKVISAFVAFAGFLHSARMLWILEHPFDSWLWV